MAKIKGTAISTVVRLLKEQGSLAEIPEPLKPYLEERVLVASWYPEEDFLSLLRALAQSRPSAEKDSWLWMGRSMAHVDLLQIYSSMVQKGSPMGTLQRLPRLWRLYHNSGRADVGQLDPSRAQIQVADYAYADEDFCRWMKGYIAEMLKIGGARSVQVKSLRTGTLDKPARWLAQWRE